MGRASLENNDPSTALDAFNVVLADQPDHFRGRYYRILTLHRLNRNSQALHDSDGIIVDFPDPKWGYIQRGKSLMVLARRAEAFENYVAAEETLGPDNAVLYWHADALANDGQFAAALEVIDRALTLDGSGGDDRLLKSCIALEMCDNPLARWAAEESLRVGEDDPCAHYYVAISMIHSVETKDGLCHFDQVMKGGLPDYRVGAFAKEPISAGRSVEAFQLRQKY